MLKYLYLKFPMFLFFVILKCISFFSLTSLLKNYAENCHQIRLNTAFSAWDHSRVLEPFLEPWTIWPSPQHFMVKVISRTSPILILNWICVAFMLTSANHHHLILMERIIQIITIINQNIIIYLILIFQILIHLYVHRNLVSDCVWLVTTKLVDIFCKIKHYEETLSSPAFQVFLFVLFYPKNK